MKEVKLEQTSAKVAKPLRDENGRLLPGQVSLNPAGKPAGALSFKVKWENFIEKVAKETNMTPTEIDEDLLAVGLKKAMSGDYAFYKDIHDRIYGKPQQSIDHTTGGDKLGHTEVNLEDKEAIDAFHTTLKKNRNKRIQDEHSRLANPEQDKE